MRAAGSEQDLAPPRAEPFEDWIAPHRTAMWRLAARYAPGADAEDVVQDALVVAWRRRERFDAARGGARAWLLTLTADQCRRHHRSRSRRATVALTDIEAPVGDEADLPLRHAVDRLARRQREAVILHYYVGCPIAETAQVMGVSTGTVKATLAQARARLASILGEDIR